ncbi:hypothetical protein GGR50DRAFT_170393 [Xylaria sp. CBS 124048]|nr:hypothetical protein GGR50DRAFT_170393 [Xylaria sp. CBS 124048]
MLHTYTPTQVRHIKKQNPKASYRSTNSLRPSLKDRQHPEAATKQITVRMGAKASKPAQTASRKFPTKPSIPPQRGAPTGRSEPKSVKDDAIHADGQDPTFDLDALKNPIYSQRLREMGVANPQPTHSNSSTATRFPFPTSAPSPTYTQTSTSTNPSSAAAPNYSKAPPMYPLPTQNRTLSALEARRELQKRADAEFEDPSRGREFLDAATLRRALLLRERGGASATTARQIEARLRLREGVVARLGPPGVTVPVEGTAMVKQTYGGLHE